MADADPAKSKIVCPPEISKDLEIFRTLLKQEPLPKLSDVKKILYKIFDEKHDKLKFILDLSTFSKNLPKKLGFFPLIAIQAFKEWVKDKSYPATIEIKLCAVDLIVKLLSNTFTLCAIEIFKLKEEETYIKTIALDYYENKNYKEALHLIGHFDLENEPEFKDCVYVLYLMGHYDGLLIHLKKQSREKQREFLLSFDNICSNNASIRNFFRLLGLEHVPNKNDVVKIYDNKFLRKRLGSLIEELNFNIREFPKLYYRKVSGTVHYLVSRMFGTDNPEFSYHAWEEMTIDIVEDFPTIHTELLEKLLWYRADSVAYRIARLLSIPQCNWPRGMSLGHYPEFTPLDEIYPSDGCLEYPDSMIINSVTTVDHLKAAIDNISQNYDVVSIDAEWKPDHGVSALNKVSLIQLAVEHTVYLIDVLALRQPLKDQYWKYFQEKVMCNADILKLGFGVSGDLEYIEQTIKDEKTPPSVSYENVVDLCTFFNKLKQHHPDIVKKIEDSRTGDVKDNSEEHKGLSQLCLTFLGKPLDKQEQSSNWEKRPLRYNQVLYAAMDVVSLLMVHKKLVPILQQHNLDLNKVLAISSPKKAEKKPVEYPPIEISKFRAIVHHGVESLGKFLRLCGADVLITEEEDYASRASEMAMADDRFLIVCSRKFRYQMPAEKFYCVPNTVNVKEQAKLVFEHFNVQCNDADLFTRCALCNANQYYKISNNELLKSWLDHVGPNVPESETGPKFDTVYKCDVTTTDGATFLDVSIQLRSFKSVVLERVEYFFICSSCGKVYWDGSHAGRFRESMSEVIDVKSTEKNDNKILLGNT